MQSRTALLRLLIAVALIAAACSGSDDTTTDTTTTDTTTAQTSAATTEAPGSTTTSPLDTPPDTAPPSPAKQLLDNAIRLVGDSYLFTSEVSVNGELVSAASGRNVGNGAELQLDQQSTSIIYRSLGEQRWVLSSEAEDWVQLEDSQDSASPLAGLGQPTEIEIVSDDGATVELLGTYDPAVLSLDSPGLLKVSLTVVDDILTGIDFSDEIAGGEISLVATFTPQDDLEPVVAP
jgi:hypothetical protein